MIQSPAEPATPHLVDRLTGASHPLRERCTEIGRSNDSQLRVDDPTVSRRHCAIRLDGDAAVLEALSSTNPTYRNGSPVEGAVALAEGDEIRVGDRSLIYRDGRGSGSSASADATLMAGGSAATAERTILGDREEATSSESLAGWSRIPTAATMVLGRERHRVTVHLDHPLVSRLHAKVSCSGATATIQDLGSANGTFVNGVRIARETALRIGDSVKIGPFLLHFAGDAFSSEPVVRNLELVCRNLSRTVRAHDGAQRVLLDDVTLVFRPREFVCLIGPSGSGKSTLLNALAARAPSTRGSVELNGLDLYANFDSLRGDIAVVPQRDVVHDLLSVEQALRYTALLRLPPDTAADEREARIDDVLDQVGLEERRRAQIRTLSGGQLKRASLANEILAEPSLLFLDEVTSGLDEHADGEMMRLFREIADRGRTVVCITHSLANVAKTASLIVVLAPGGKLAFVGTPEEACSYFGVPDLGGVYGVVEREPPAALQARFREHPLHRRYVLDRLPASQRLMAAPSAGRRPVGAAAATAARQCFQLARRAFELILADRRTLLTLIAQPALVGLVLAIVIGRLGPWPLAPGAAFRSAEELASYINGVQSTFFFLMVAAFWFGANNAAKEIVKERQIYAREQAVIVRPLAYYGSKFLVLGSTTVAQIVFLAVATSFLTSLPGGLLSQLAILVEIGLVGTSLGLLISACSASEDTAAAAVPLLLIPQVILSNGVAHLSGFGDWLGRLLVGCYWANESLNGSLTTANYDGGSYWSGFFLLLLHLAVFALGAVVVLELRARRLQIHALLRAGGFEPR